MHSDTPFHAVKSLGNLGLWLLLASVILTMIPALGVAQNSGNVTQRDHSFLRIGTQTVDYKEDQFSSTASVPITTQDSEGNLTISTQDVDLPLNTEANNSSIYLQTGGYFDINQALGIQYSFLSTFSVNQGEEKVKVENNQGVDEIPNTLQKSDFDFYNNDIDVSLAHKTFAFLRTNLGLNYYSYSIRKYNTVSGIDEDLVLQSQPISIEGGRTLVVMAGVNYEDRNWFGQDLRYNAHFAYGLPVWQETVSKINRRLEFENDQGYNIKTGFEVHFPFKKEFDLGLVYHYFQYYREKDRRKIDGIQRLLPKVDLQSTFIGLSLIWNVNFDFAEI